MEFLRLSDWQTGSPIFVDPRSIIAIRHLDADENYGQRTRIDLGYGNCFLVKESASEVVLSSGRGFDDTLKSDLANPNKRRFTKVQLQLK